MKPPDSGGFFVARIRALAAVLSSNFARIRRIALTFRSGNAILAGTPLYLPYASSKCGRGRNTLRAKITNRTFTKLLFRPNAPGSREPAPGTRFRLVFQGTYSDAVARIVDGTDGSGAYWVHDNIPPEERSPGLFDSVVSPHGG